MTVSLTDIIRVVRRKGGAEFGVSLILDRWDTRQPPKSEVEAFMRPIVEAMLEAFNIELRNLRQQMRPLSEASNPDLDPEVAAGIYERAAEKLMVKAVEAEKAAAAASFAQADKAAKLKAERIERDILGQKDDPMYGRLADAAGQIMGEPAFARADLGDAWLLAIRDELLARLDVPGLSVVEGDDGSIVFTIGSTDVTLEPR